LTKNKREPLTLLDCWCICKFIVWSCSFFHRVWNNYHFISNKGYKKILWKLRGYKCI